jgi:hypothetical protein
VVRFSPHAGASWTGNFQPGLTPFSTARRHPDERHVLVIAGGEAYIVDAAAATAGSLPLGAISALWPVPDSRDIVLDRQGIAFLRLGATGLVWHTRRISWDGFRDIAIGPDRIWGQAWTPVSDEFLPFSVDIRTGRTSGGPPNAPNPDWELLAGARESS